MKVVRMEGKVKLATIITERNRFAIRILILVRSKKNTLEKTQINKTNKFQKNSLENNLKKG
jgi:hypothetical protein